MNMDLIDPPTPFSPVMEWEAFRQSMQQALIKDPASPQLAASPAEADAMIARLHAGDMA